MDALYRRCLAGSLALHAGLLVFGNLSRHVRLPPPERIIDLTLPLGRRDNPAPGPLGRPALPPAAKPVPDAPPVVAPVVPAPVAPEAVRPVPDPVPAPPEVAPVPAVVPTAPSGSSQTGSPSGSASGDPNASGGGGDGGPGTRSATPQVKPVLLNRAEVLANLRKFYPEAERLAGRQADVIVKMLIGVSGKVEEVTVLGSGGASFDAAAKKVAERMRFSPALLDGRPVALWYGQRIQFQISLTQAPE